MSEIVLCNKPVSSGYLKDTCDIEPDHIHRLSCQKPEHLQAFTPYLLNKEKLRHQHRLLTPLSPTPVAKELTNLSLSFSGQEVFTAVINPVKTGRGIYLLSPVVLRPALWQVR